MKEYYLKATKLMGRPSVADVFDEVQELFKDKTLEELHDVVHSVCRYARVPNTITYHIAKPTATKHALRMKERGCPRSERNCKLAGDTCCCKTT